MPSKVQETRNFWLTFSFSLENSTEKSISLKTELLAIFGLHVDCRLDAVLASAGLTDYDVILSLTAATTVFCCMSNGNNAK